MTVTLAETVQQEHCNTAQLTGLARQVAEQFLRTVSAMAITDLTSHVEIVGPSTIPYLQRNAGDALIAAIKEQGQKVTLIHALRTLPQQYAFWKWYLDGRCGKLASAMPGSSPFECGVAIEIDDADAWVKVLRSHNWQWCGSKNSAQFIFHGPQDPTFLNTSIWAFQRVWNNHHPEDELKPDGVLTPQTIAKLEMSPAAGF